MTMSMKVVALSLLSLLASFPAAYAAVYDITRYGAIGNGITDSTQALAAAWRDACGCMDASVVLIPKGGFLLGETFLFGPCRSPITVRLDGVLLAQPNPAGYKKKGAWITFKNIIGLNLLGMGTLDGQGAFAWKQCGQNCANLPVNVRFARVTNAAINDITSLNSKHFHLCIGESTNVVVTNIKIIAPEDSPNTDGIHISHSTAVTVQDSIIATGDDCVSIIHTNKDIKVLRVKCGPGHGISVGSLGKYLKEGPVDGVFVSQCTFTNTNNGIRVKTMANKQPGSASNINFEDLVMNNVSNPVIIDQTYCPDGSCAAKGGTSAIQLSNISFRRIHGSSASPIAVKLQCSKTTPCQNVQLADINLSYTGTRGTLRSTCCAVNPIITGVQIPKICSALL